MSERLFTRSLYSKPFNPWIKLGRNLINEKKEFFAQTVCKWQKFSGRNSENGEKSGNTSSVNPCALLEQNNSPTLILSFFFFDRTSRFFHTDKKVSYKSWISGNLVTGTSDANKKKRQRSEGGEKKMRKTGQKVLDLL